MAGRVYLEEELGDRNPEHVPCEHCGGFAHVHISPEQNGIGQWVQLADGGQHFFCSNSCLGQFVREEADRCRRDVRVWNGNGWQVCGGPSSQSVRCPECECRGEVGR